MPCFGAAANLLLPDPRVLWRRKATKAAAHILRSALEEGRPFDAIATTGPPHSVHLIGLALKKKWDIPWLADFRDLWREMDYLEDFHPTPRTRRRHLEMERAVVNTADFKTYSSPSTLFSLAPDKRPETLSKFELIYNGWDQDDLEDPAPSHRARTGSEEEAAFQLGHFGSLFPTRDAPGLWKAIRQWNANLGETRKAHSPEPGRNRQPACRIEPKGAHARRRLDRPRLPFTWRCSDHDATHGRPLADTERQRHRAKGHSRKSL